MKLAEYSKEALLAFWQGIVDRVDMPISFKQRVEKIAAAHRGFLVKCADREYHTRSILLAIGRRGTPRKLGVAGEELPKVVYRLVDPRSSATSMSSSWVEETAPLKRPSRSRASAART